MVKADQEALYVNTVVPLIKESGFPIILSQTTDTPYDPDVGFVPPVETPYDGFAIETESDYTSIPNSIVTKVVKTIMAVEIPQPKADVDTISFKGEDFSVLHTEPTETGEVLFFYTIYLGR